VHAGNNLPPAYTIQASDGALTSPPSAVTVTFNSSAGPGTTTPPAGGGGSGSVTPPADPPTGGGTSSGSGDDTSALDVPAPVSRGGGAEETVAEPEVLAPAPAPVAERVAVAKVEQPVVEPLTVQSSAPTVTQTAQSFRPEFAQVRRPEIVVELGRISLPEPDGDRLIKLDLDSIRMTSLALSVGAIWWATRATGLLASLLSSLPAWRNFDPLPVLGRGEDEDEEDEWAEAYDAQLDQESAEEEQLLRKRFSNDESQPIDQDELKKSLNR